MDVRLHEIFSSRQGEGPYTGDWMTFVRLQGCALRCQWCDTPEALGHQVRPARIERPVRSGHFVELKGAISLESLTALVSPFPDQTLALTGGEPLEQAEFLVRWLPTYQRRYQILLETGGILTAALTKVLPWIDIVSMDLKLPSSTGMRAYWDEHRAFLTQAIESSIETYVKIVVTGQTQIDEVEQGVALVQSIDPTLPIYLQPASPTADFTDVPSGAQLEHLEAMTRGTGRSVTVQGQMHKVWGIL
jgi:7-carboxy-7-deazaguanine synthase